MEQLLNAVWLAMALVGVCGWLWYRRDVRSDSNQIRLLWRLMAIGLVLVLLFFAISITDDLHWTEMAAEASEGPRKLLTSFAFNAPGAPELYLATLVFAVGLLIDARKRSLIIPVLSIDSPTDGYLHEFFGRAPPVAA